MITEDFKNQVTKEYKNYLDILRTKQRHKDEVERCIKKYEGDLEDICNDISYFNNVVDGYSNQFQFLKEYNLEPDTPQI
jgi:hypothetical protein